MEKREIIERLKRGDKFVGCYPGAKRGLVMSVKNWNGRSEDATAVCECEGSTWQEEWDDMTVTVNAFINGEYGFVR